MPNHYNRDHAIFEVLLVANVLVRRQKQIIPSLLSDGEKINVPQPLPSQVCRDADRVPGQIAANWDRRSLIEKN